MKRKDEKQLKELKDLLKELLKTTGVMDKMEKLTNEALNEALKEETEISIKKYEDGKAETNIKGSTMGLLVTLAGLEKSILEKTKTPAGLFELIKNGIGTADVESKDIEEL